MRIELRILSGARAGQTDVFDKPYITVGRKLTNDLRFDPNVDLDVSAQHAEFIERDGRWYVSDRNSSNGTFLNGAPISAETPIKDGDIIAFGKNGPTVEVRGKGEITGAIGAVPRTAVPVRPAKPAGGAKGVGPSTQERVAVLVRQQTRSMKTTLIGTMVGLGALAIAAYWMGTREGSRQVAEMQKVLAQNESTTAALLEKTRMSDTSFANALSRHSDSLRLRAQATAKSGNEAQIAAVKHELEQNRIMQAGLAQIDFSGISQRNNPAIAFVVTRLDGELFGGSAFAVSKSGLLVTNRHNVVSPTGKATTQLEVQFPNSSTRLSAHVVKVADPDTDDLALIQIDAPGAYPTVAAIRGSGEVAVGSPLVTIGYPFSLELPMPGGSVQTTLSAGHVSKRIASLLQIDALGAHGLSGAPVFDAQGYVVGVVWGGPKSDNRIVYSVPSDRLVAFMAGAAGEIVH